MRGNADIILRYSWAKCVYFNPWPIAAYWVHLAEKYIAPETVPPRKIGRPRRGFCTLYLLCRGEHKVVGRLLTALCCSVWIDISPKALLTRDPFVPGVLRCRES